MNFDYIKSETSPDDRKSLLAIQQAVRDFGKYRYLEIGSHLGGTIQPHIADPLCHSIYSIDKRSIEQPDERGKSYVYGPENCTQRMRDLLSRIPGADLSKLTTFDMEASAVPAAEISPPDYCFVDGEHTDRAIQSDFLFCETVSNGKLVFVAHDAFILYRGLHEIILRLARNGRSPRVLFLPTHLMLIDLVGRVSNHPAVIAQALEAWRGYLEGMLINDYYRREFLKLCTHRQSIPI